MRRRHLLQATCPAEVAAYFISDRSKVSLSNLINNYFYRTSNPSSATSWQEALDSSNHYYSQSSIRNRGHYWVSPCVHSTMTSIPAAFARVNRHMHVQARISTTAAQLGGPCTVQETQ